MHDLRALRETPDAYSAGWRLRGVEDDPVPEILRLDERLRAAQTALQAAQSRRNEASKLIGAAKARRDEAEAVRLMAEVEADKEAIGARGEEVRAVEAELRELLAGLPNLAAPDVPEGADESGNVEVGRWDPAAPSPSSLIPAEAGTRAFPEPASADQNLGPRFRGDERSFKPRDHVELGEALGLMDFEAAARMSGARFVVLKGQLARLERALAQFMLDLQTTEHGYTEVSPPVLVRDEALFGTGQLPKFRQDLFQTAAIDWDEFQASVNKTVREKYESDLRALDALVLEINGGRPDRLPELAELTDKLRYVELEEYVSSDEFRFARDLWLIPTAEVSLANLVREQITPAEQLPLRLTACTPCFRAEAGASGRDTRGMIRQHQFLKVELVSITAPEDSEAEHERMTACAEAVLERLGLPYRRMLLCTGDMGFSARKTFDLEVWLPSQGTYREISSCSNCGDFQARRMDARLRRKGEKGTEFVHTLNGSGLAVGRTLVAVMETFQDEGGRIAVPEALRPYMGGLTHIEATGSREQGAG